VYASPHTKQLDKSYANSIAFVQRLEARSGALPPPKHTRKEGLILMSLKFLKKALALAESSKDGFIRPADFKENVRGNFYFMVKKYKHMITKIARGVFKPNTFAVRMHLAASTNTASQQSNGKRQNVERKLQDIINTYTNQEIPKIVHKNLLDMLIDKMLPNENLSDNQLLYIRQLLVKRGAVVRVKKGFYELKISPENPLLVQLRSLVQEMKDTDLRIRALEEELFGLKKLKQNQQLRYKLITERLTEQEVVVK
jgi:hypothetical protein